MHFTGREAIDCLDLLIGQMPQEHLFRLRLRITDQFSILAQEALHSSSLMETAVVEAVWPEEKGHAIPEEPVVPLEGHNPRPLAPVLALRRRQALPDPANGDCFLIFDANGGAPQNALDGVMA